MFKKIHIKQHELGLRFRKGEFHGFVRPGEFRQGIRALVRRERIEIVDTRDVRFRHRDLDLIARHADAPTHFHVLDLTDTQRALVFKDGRLEGVLGAGLFALFKTPYEIRTELFDTAQDVRFEHPLEDVVIRHPGTSEFLGVVQAEPHVEKLVFRNGALMARVREGRFVYFQDAAKVAVREVPLREQTLDVGGQEIMTRDKVTLRVNLIVTFTIVDTVKAVTLVDNAEHALYREAQLALRAAVGARVLDELLTDKQAVGDEVRTAIAARAEAFGVAVRGVGLRDIILPGDMKTILNQVITAQKEAEANVIKRREETAAARSQANTAKLLAESPALARLKELELLQEILAGTKTAFVFGRGDLAGQVRTLIDQGDA